MRSTYGKNRFNICRLLRTSRDAKAPILPRLSARSCRVNGIYIVYGKILKILYFVKNCFVLEDFW